MSVKEDVFHFISTYPRLKIIRKIIFEKEELSLIQFIDYSRTKNVKKMIEFPKVAIICGNDLFNLML